MFNKLLALLGLSALAGSTAADDAARAVLGPGPDLPRHDVKTRTRVIGAQQPYGCDPGGVHAKLFYHGGFGAKNRGRIRHDGARAHNEYHTVPLDRMTAEYLSAKADPELAPGAEAMMTDYFADAAAQRNAAKRRRRAIRRAGGQA